jgi:hypothetical protein
MRNALRQRVQPEVRHADQDDQDQDENGEPAEQNIVPARPGDIAGNMASKLVHTGNSHDRPAVFE